MSGSPPMLQASARRATARKLLAAAGDQPRRSWLLHRLRFEDRVLDMEISTVEGRSFLSPHRQDEANGFLHLPDAHRRPCREFPAILVVFGLEIAGADPER